MEVDLRVPTWLAEALEIATRTSSRRAELSASSLAECFRVLHVWHRARSLHGSMRDVKAVVLYADGSIVFNPQEDSDGS